MIVHIDQESPLPPYEQIRSQVATMAATGVLRAGDRLPPIRQLARDLGVAIGTVARAYRELEGSGLIATRGRNGTFVDGGTGLQVGDKEQEQSLRAAALEFAIRAHQLGVDSDAATGRFREMFDAIRSDPPAARTENGIRTDSASRVSK